MPGPKKSSPHQTDIDLAQQIARLEGVVNTGFEGVNRRLDTLNGRVGKHDELFGKILGDEKYQAGTRQGIVTSWKVVFALVTITLGILAIIFGPH
jgi:hypothetical protein